MKTPLPYTDTKPIGAADFYFAINATFRFIEQRLGIDGLRRYWTDLGQKYFAPVAEQWAQQGLPGVADYWRAFFAAEPGSDVAVTASANEVVLEVKTCPMIKHLRDHGREILPCFCQHCYFINEAIAAKSGFAARVEGGNGSCVQRVLPLSDALPPQELSHIKTVG